MIWAPATCSRRRCSCAWPRERPGRRGGLRGGRRGGAPARRGARRDRRSAGRSRRPSRPTAIGPAERRYSASARSITGESSAGSSSPPCPQARAASSRLPPTGAISTSVTCAWGAHACTALVERVQEHLARLEGAADQANGEGSAGVGEPRLADHGGDLLAELGGAALIQLARDRVALLGELGGLDRERRDLALGQRLGVDEAGERLDARPPRRTPERRRRAPSAGPTPRGRAAPP